MKLIPTGLSYVRLFVAWTLGAWTLGALGLLLVGIVLRFAFIFPEHKMFADSDAVLAALCAFDIMDGKLPVFFPGGTRLGALSCYSAAAAFELFGISRLTLTIPSLLFSCGFNLFMYLFFRETLGKRLSFLALMFIVLPPMQFLLVTYPPWGYAEILLFCSAALWLGSLLAKETPSVSVAFFYGLCVGLGLYSSLQSLMVLLPQWAWLLLVKKKWKIDSKAAWVLAGCALGFGPWLLFVASSGISSVFGGQLLRTSNTWYQVWLNITYFFDYNLPVLLFECNAGQLLVFSRKTLQAGLYAMALLPFFFVFFGYARYRSISYYGWDRDRFMLALFSAALFLTTLAMYSFSGAGAVRGWTVRYIAPIYIAMATAWAIGLSVPIRIFPKATWCIVIAIVLLNVPGYPIINHPVRKAWEAAMARDQRLLEVIQQNDIQAVVGDYWQVYYLNFLSRRGIAAIPTISALDYMSYANKLNGRSVRWALIANSPEKLTKWADRCQLRGSLLNINPGTCLFLPSPNPPIVDSTAFLKLVQAAAILH